MDYITILSQTLLSFVVLFILARLSGYRQISQMSMFDYINGITIGSIAAEMATGLDMHWSYPLIAMVGYGLLTLLVSCLSARSLKLRRFVTGNPLVLLHNGSIYRKNLKKAHVTINEMLEECRISGYFSLNDLQTILLESNGKFSFIPAAGQKPVTTEDLHIPAEADCIHANLIIDGALLKTNLQTAGRDEHWLDKKLRQQGLTSVKDVFLAVFEQPDTLLIFPKEAGDPPPDILS